MTYEEALVRFKGDLAMMEQTSTHKTKQMEMYELAIKALESLSNIKEAYYSLSEFELKEYIREEVKKYDT